ncbi:MULTISPECIES: RnfABCDGE type electron transport complex subunit A [Ruminococcus]|uniref:Ion-translocating oxidoreductase complex subunit A n=1 Tax=Ruminococcus flavefaciens TaxID=1265 RepID=A0A315XV82_RUMFL|nr:MULTISPECIES: RnfABCDGE type electron transport complex subunit A [Ruminococcus]MBQ6252680.1 RnfABCDGE type electron transport complex subunit A [Ruminococcus sp.]MBR0511814.1 RnfABCDGE type electron transport complex subunit A [Ruminococcus sp.]MBR3665578.1 RnfABCDGE type electron transport complex subunit A [Ruminococcus sp.]MBR6995776.1 RnfABCDGE type electron transport complex subunit A [Ruminococcus sp.]PWJ10829.1 electron transport complex protein RnfA [Ruminococcus flavefaciens]
MKTIIVILLSAMLTDNFVLSKFMGICPFLGVSKKLDSAAGMGVAVTFVMICATIVTYPIHHGILVPNGLEYLDTVVFILVIALFVQLVENFLKKCVPSLYSSLGVYLPLITTNCAVLGVTVLNIDNGFSFGQSIINALGGGLGFMLALVIFSGVRKKLEYADIPETFKGVPATLIAASIVSVSFMGFAGLFN